MSSKVLSFFSFLLLPAIVSADAVWIKKVSGTVEYKNDTSAAWNQAQPGAALPSGGKVRTGADGRAELGFQNKTTVWLKPSTSLGVEQKGKKHNEVALESGSLKVRVPHLKFREKFNIKTPLAVASVRGTVFTIDEKSVQTFFGHVNMHMEDGKKIEVPQGIGFNGDTLSMLSQMEEVLGLEDWSPGISDDERRAGLQEFLENRQQMRDYADDALARNQELVDSLADRMKEADFAAGRTLTDVHGNLVRVEQRLDRPANNVIQVTNVTLRKSYKSGGLRHYAYNGPDSARVDALIAKSEFNKGLPDNINEFPGFFVANENSLKIDRASLVLANLSNPDDVVVMAFLGERPSLAAPGASDDIDADLYLGDGITRTDLFNLNASNVGGHVTDGNMAKYQENAGVDSINFDGANGELYGRTAKLFTRMDGTWGDADVWLATESFVINNGGQVRNISDFTSGATNYQDLLSNTAGQSVIFAKTNNLDNTPSQTDLFTGGRNIDLVIIPDLFYSVVKTMATSADAFKTTY